MRIFYHASPKNAILFGLFFTKTAILEIMFRTKTGILAAFPHLFVSAF